MNVAAGIRSTSAAVSAVSRRRARAASTADELAEDVAGPEHVEHDLATLDGDRDLQRRRCGTRRTSWAASPSKKMIDCAG